LDVAAPNGAAAAERAPQPAGAQNPARRCYTHYGYGRIGSPAIRLDFNLRIMAMAQDDRAALIAHENLMIRRLRFLVDLTFATLAQDNSLTLDEAWDHVRALKGAAVAMFPGKEMTFDLVYLPRFSRLLQERFNAS
jgi:hypothetical protein